MEIDRATQKLFMSQIGFAKMCTMSKYIVVHKIIEAVDI